MTQASPTPDHIILAGLKAGTPYKLIAHQLGLSTKATKRRAQYVKQRVGANHRREVLAAALPCPSERFMEQLGHEYRLTKREQLVFSLLVTRPDLSRAGIAGQPRRSEATVRFQPHSIYTKLRVGGRLELLLLVAARAGK